MMSQQAIKDFAELLKEVYSDDNYVICHRGGSTFYVYGKEFASREELLANCEELKRRWDGGSVAVYAPGKSIGGDEFVLYKELEGIVQKEGRKYYECDINTLGNEKRGAERIIYSNDGMVYYTPDHYNSFELLYSEE